MRMVNLSILLATASVALTGCLPTLGSNDPPVVKQTVAAVPAKKQAVKTNVAVVPAKKQTVKTNVVKKPLVPAQVVVPPVERAGGGDSGGAGGGGW